MRSRTVVSLAIMLLCGASALYEEPPGGCKGPPDDFEPIGMNPNGPKAIRRQPRPPPPKAPPSVKEQQAAYEQAEDESQQELQRQAYEQESMDLMGEEDEDWERIEREHNRELMVRLCIQVIASMITLGFVASLLYARYQQLQGKGGAGASDAPTTFASSSAAPTTFTLKVEGMTCNGCRSKVEKALAGVTGVTDASVVLETALATVDGGSAEALIAAVEAAGKKATLFATTFRPKAEAKAEPKKEAKPAAAKKEAKKEAKQKEGKGKKEAPSVEDKAKAAREKLLAKVVKEGGKKGVEIEGASDMGGLDFFCTTVESPDGDVDLLHTAMAAMNAQPDPNAEDRKGCSGHVGKMIFSAGVHQLALVAYVPADKAETVAVVEWVAYVLGVVGGKVMASPVAPADSPQGGSVVQAIVGGDADNGKFPLKDKDAAMAAAFAFLRQKGAFPEDDDDDDDEMIFGDDDNLDDYE